MLVSRFINSLHSVSYNFQLKGSQAGAGRQFRQRGARLLPQPGPWALPPPSAWFNQTLSSCPELLSEHLQRSTRRGERQPPRRGDGPDGEDALSVRGTRRAKAPQRASVACGTCCLSSLMASPSSWSLATPFLASLPEDRMPEWATGKSRGL